MEWERGSCQGELPIIPLVHILAGQSDAPGEGCSVTYLLPRLWLFLCLGTGGVERLPATDASGQVGLRRNLAELEPAEGPVNRAERESDDNSQ
jgi:hypothetical protein